MKIISGGRCSGKTSYIWGQCEKLKGKKLLIVPTMQQAEELRYERDMSKNENVKNTEIHSASEVFGFGAAKGIQWDHVLIDEIQSVFCTALHNNMTTASNTGIVATLAKEPMLDIKEVCPKHICDICICRPVCNQASYYIDLGSTCEYYHQVDKEEDK